MWHRWLRARFGGGKNWTFIFNPNRTISHLVTRHRNTVCRTVPRVTTYPVGVLYALKRWIKLTLPSNDTRSCSSFLAPTSFMGAASCGSLAENRPSQQPFFYTFELGGRRGTANVHTQNFRPWPQSQPAIRRSRYRRESVDSGKRGRNNMWHEQKEP